MTRHQQDNYRRRHRRLQAMTAATIAVLAMTSACNGDSEEPNPLPPETSTTSTPTETPTPETDAERATVALERFLAIQDEAYTTGVIPQDLPDVAGSESHQALQVNVQYMLESKIKVKGEYGHLLSEPTKVGANRYRIVDCYDWKAADETQAGQPVEQYAPTGDPLSSPLKVSYEVAKIDGLWKVDGTSFGGNKTC